MDRTRKPIAFPFSKGDQDRKNRKGDTFIKVIPIPFGDEKEPSPLIITFGDNGGSIPLYFLS